MKVNSAKDESPPDYSDGDSTDSDVIYLPPPRKKNQNIRLLSNQQPQQQEFSLEANEEIHPSDPISPPACHGKGNVNLGPSVIKIWNGSTHVSATIVQDTLQVPLVSTSSSSSSLSNVIEAEDAQPATSTGAGEKKFKCDFCEYRSDFKTQKTYHMNMHAGKRPFKCEVCSKSFFRPSTLHLHRKTHSPPTFICDFCPKMFHSKWHRNEHMNTHTGAKPFECEQCGKCFNNHSGLGQHRKTHSAPKYECPFCHKMFHQSSHCKAHWNGIKNKDIACPVRRQQQLGDKSN